MLFGIGQPHFLPYPLLSLYVYLLIYLFYKLLEKKKKVFLVSFLLLRRDGKARHSLAISPPQVIFWPQAVVIWLVVDDSTGGILA